VKGTVVPPIVERAAGLLVTGTLARDSMIARGAHSVRVRVFANTIDVERFGEQVDRLAVRQREAPHADRCAHSAMSLGRMRNTCRRRL
jgi:hypothetical protein